jgi:hypothetical protein
MAMDNWWPEEDLVPVKPDMRLALSREDKIREVEEELHQEAAATMRDTLRFADLTPEDLANQDPSFVPEWMVAQAGGDRALAGRRFRIAKYALMSSKEAPVGLKLSKDLMVGMAKVRAKEKTPPKILNMVVVHMTGNLPKFEEIEVEPQR